METKANHIPPSGSVPAAQYIRMSTDHQEFSTANQADAIQDYAVRHGYRIVQTYADEGRSGLQITHREALTRLLADVQSGKAAFKAILVFDISRWGRFQDADESAYYEFMCKRAGIHVVYCAEQFQNDGSVIATMIKSVKRTMAAEYSRELSAKVFQGQCRLIQLGFRQGGPSGYGLRRMLVDNRGQPKGLLKPGEHKSLQTDRVVLVPGPDAEVETVRRIYELFTHEGLRESQIADRLNGAGVVYTEFGRPWTAGIIRQVLTNEKYIGNNVYNRKSFKLKSKRINNPPDMWVRADSVFAAIITLDVFNLARSILLERARKFSDAELLEKLRDLLSVHGTLSGGLIDAAEGMPASTVYQNRFGSLLAAYAAIGHVPERDFEYLEINRRMRTLEAPFAKEVVEKLSEFGAAVTQDAKTGHLVINGEYSAAILLTRCRQSPVGALSWLVQFKSGAAADITVVVRMDESNQAPVDFFLVPRIGMGEARLRLKEHNAIDVETFHFESLGYFFSMAARAAVEEAA